NHNSSCWVRVALPWAGNQLGQQAIPRIGQEVIIDFIGGDPDRPICSGSVHNQFNMPPWQLPSQQALMGIRSRELTDQGGGNSATGRSNHLILDDTHDQIQAQLKSDHDYSQLSLGFITRIENKQGRKDPRGQGFELRTDGHGAIRAKDGLLITTEARDKAQGHITSLEETAQRLQQAQSQHSTLAEAAQQAGAQEQSDQSDVAKEIKQKNNDIKGTDNTNADKGQFPELAKPHIVIASPTGIATTTPGNTQQHSGQHHAITAEEHISLSSGKSLLASTREAIRLFAYKAGMKLIAANADIEIQALKNSINLIAKLNISHNAESIQINATKAVIINGGGSYTKWSDQGIEQGTNGTWMLHAATHSFQDGKKMGIDIQGLPHVDEYDEKFAFHLPCGTPIVGQSYHAKSSIGEHASKTTSGGATPSIYTSSPQPLQVAPVWHAFNSPEPMTRPGSSNTSNNKGDNNAG
ncbi:DUF2345 domain-containing protein, partial [Undibacterium sp. Dicai25W]|uniref:DUF2345 domain-containing protein n=1 Tax=Undibacterium sp. Dicai25W TaxID=3413034 RepID=UPI003BF0518D